VFVKTAFIEHLELDSKVICDQIVSPDDPMEDEDKAIRERLRGLFLTKDAWGPLFAQLRNQGSSGAEQE
jgi:hypothetical protein